MDREVDVVATLISYDDQGWLDHYEDGSYASYKISVLIIREPAQYAGNGLMISHAESPAIDSYWRNIDGIIQFRIADDLLRMSANAAAMVGENFIDIVNVKEAPPDATSEQLTDR